MAVTATVTPCAARALKVRPTAPPASSKQAGGAALSAAPRSRTPLTSAMEAEVRARRDRWSKFRDVQMPRGMEWDDHLSKRLRRARPLSPATAAAAGRIGQRLTAEPETIRVAILRIDFLTDRGGSASTGTGRFDLSGPDTTLPPIDRPPHDRRFFQKHGEALKRYYDAQSYGRVVVEVDVWPRQNSRAYSTTDMADFGPWEFSQDIYRAAVHMYRSFLFAADSQSVAIGERIPWDSYDRIVMIHAGSDLQSDLRQDSKEDIPSFTIGVVDTDVVIFPDSTNRPIDRAAIIPETIAQDDFFGTINGVLAHECGHLLFGMTDVYDILSGRPIAGYWSLMDSGNQVGSIVVLPDQTELFAIGLLPPSIDAFQRSMFISSDLAPVEVDYGATMDLKNSERYPDFRKVTLSSDEYLLLENRHIAPADSIELDQDDSTRVILGPKKPDRYEYDALLPGAGTLVWHVDESVLPLESYFPVDTALRANPDFGWNTNPFRLGLSVVEADALMDLGDPGSPYIVGAPFDPYFKSNNPSLSDTTAPNLRPHIGTRPHVRLDFHSEPDSVMSFSAYRTWALPAFPVRTSFPVEGPVLLTVDADGDTRPEICWAGGDTTSADSSALFAVRNNGTGLGGGPLAFFHLDRRPLREMAALPLGGTPEAPAGPAYFVATTRNDGTPEGGRVWLVDATGPVPGWPVTLPAPATTPPVVASNRIFVGAADGKVYALKGDGTIAATSPVLFDAPVTGRLAADRHPLAQSPLAVGDVRIAAGGANGSVAVVDFGLDGANNETWALVPGWPVSTGSAAFRPDFLWIDFNGRSSVPSASATRAAATSTITCNGGRSLVAHFGDRLWAWCITGEALPGWGHAFADTLVDGLGAGDPDGDGYPEVLTQTIHSGAMFVNVSGYPSPGWPKRTTDEDFRTGSSALALDVDADGRSEVVTMNASGVVSALRSDGKTPEGWPFATGVGAMGSPAAADFDGDGSLDLAAPDRFGRLYVYSLPVAIGSPEATSWTQTGGDPGRTSSLPNARTTTGITAVSGPLVNGSLKAYPNPARRKPVTFAYQLTEPSDVEFRIVDASGHEVASFSRSGRISDNAEVWDPGALPGGLYVARVRFRGAGTDRTEFVQLGLIR